MSDLPGEPGDPSDDPWIGLFRLLLKYADPSDDASLGPEHEYRDFEGFYRVLYRDFGGLYQEEPGKPADLSDESDLGSVRPTPPQTAPEPPQTAPNPRNGETPARSGDETPARL